MAGNNSKHQQKRSGLGVSVHIDGTETPNSDLHSAIGCWNITLSTEKN